MGNCLTTYLVGNDEADNTGSTYSNGDKKAPPPKPKPPRKKTKSTNGIESSTIDDGAILHPPANGGDTGPLEPIQFPDNAGFTCSVNGRNGWLVNEVYDFGASCGKGAFGDVYVATHRYGQGSEYRSATWTKVAIKKTAPTVLDRRGGVRIWTYDHVEDKCQEIKSLIKLKEGNPNYSCVLHMYEYYWTYNHSNGKGTLHMVTEFLGQELEVWRQNQPTLLESTVKKISGVILNALDYISSRKVIHRDIKLQNILFRVNGDIKTLKLVDFGLAKIIEGNEKASDFCGSLGYIAPEIYEQQPYLYEVDMFAFGVILFRLLCGVRPFSAPNQEKLRNDTVNLRYKIEGRNWEGVSPNALKLVRNLLIGQRQRFTAEQAINHEWFLENAVTDSVLVPDFTMSHDNVQNDNDENYSQVVALSHAPEELLPRSNGNKFFLDAAVERAVRALIRNQKYVGKIIIDDSSNNDELICVEEKPSEVALSLANYIVRLPRYTEIQCRMIFRQIVQIIKLCHDYGLAHRNLLFTSLLVDSRFDAKNNIILRGLHYAQEIKHDQPLTGHFGYLYSWYAFKAPEIDSELFHDKTVDNWSLGAALYMLLTALPPFRGDGVELITHKHRGDVVFDIVVPSNASQSLVRALLHPNPRRRMTIDQVLNSEWMTVADSVLGSYDLTLTQEQFMDF